MCWWCKKKQDVDVKTEAGMRIIVISDRVKLAFSKALLANEIGGHMSLIYRFSDADGIHSGKSGYSFGISQFDINNNPAAVLALREMNFTTDEIAALKAQTADMDKMNAKLLYHKDVVDRWDRKQLVECLEWPLLLCHEINVLFSGEETLVHIADYHNQFYMSRGGKMYRWLKSVDDLITPEMIRDFKYTLPWGIKQQARPRDKDDVWRRYYNIVKIMREDI